MSNFDDLKHIARETLETIADKSYEIYKAAEEKTKLVAKTTRLSTEIAMEKSELRKLYRDIGKRYYDLHASEPDAEFAGTCLDITASLGRIEEKQKEIDELKKTECCCRDDADDDDGDTGDACDAGVEIIIDEYANPSPEHASDDSLDDAEAEVESDDTGACCGEDDRPLES